MFCKKCGNKLRNDSKFCNVCGTNQEEFELEAYEDSEKTEKEDLKKNKVIKKDETVEKIEDEKKLDEKIDDEKKIVEKKGKPKKNKSKESKIFLILFIIFLSIAVAELVFLIMNNSDYSKLKTEKEEVESEIKKCSSNYKTCSNKNELLENNNEKLEKEKEELSQESYQEQLKNEIKSLEDKKNELQGKVDELNKEVIRIKGETKTYPAGHLDAGTDVPIGKYRIHGGSSNFIVHNSSGRLEVNIILGGRYGVDEYIYTFKSGDKIEASSSFKLTPIE